jgi:GT2 family glycosyltransferase
MISILLPLEDPPLSQLRSAVDSVTRQLYGRWELCAAACVSTGREQRTALIDYAAQDPRIRVFLSELEDGVAAAANRALAMARGELVALLGAQDEFREDALLLAAAEIVANPATCMLYSDECQIDGGGIPQGAHFKPGWNSELLLGQNYVGDLLVARADRVRAIGGFRPAFQGGHAHDLVLRLSTVCPRNRIAHLPYLLYRRRTAQSPPAPSEMEAGRLAVQDHLRSSGRPADVSLGPAPFTYRVQLPDPDPQPLVSVIIPTRNAFALLKRCVEGLLQKTEYKSFELLVVDNQTDEPQARDYLQLCRARPNFRVLTYDKPFNYSAINNFAAGQARGEFLCLLNNDTEVINPGWLNALVAWGTQPGIGAVGAKLLYPDGAIQHAGITLGIMGLAGHPHKTFPDGRPGYFGRLAVAHEVGAVTGACLLVRKATYWAVGGLNEEYLAVAYNDVDFCLKLRARGLRNIWTPQAVLYHHESKSRSSDVTGKRRARFEQEAAYILATWGDKLSEDPTYNPNLSKMREDFALAWPPQVPSPASYLAALLGGRTARTSLSPGAG